MWNGREKTVARSIARIFCPDFIIRIIADVLLGRNFDTDHYDVELSRDERHKTDLTICVPQEIVRRKIIGRGQ